MSSDHPLLPLLPLRDIVVFPFMVIPLFVGRDKSVRALEKSMAEQKNIFLSAQRNPDNNDPARKDIYETGTVANILQILKLTDGTIKVLVEGDKNLPYGVIVDLMNTLQVAGASSVGLITEPPSN